ncbi:hypothetical protein GCM10010275_09290 [Streptomyces litmocidini]|nr:hypothetical protein GCM10010275_09290 [Streptomyces litmocidini]
MISRILRLSAVPAPESGAGESGFAVSVIGIFFLRIRKGRREGGGPLRPDQDETSSALEVKGNRAAPR